jgi:hypothetical protein
MDLRLFGSVVWRHKVTVGVGFALACVLAFLSVASITSRGIVYRQPQEWAARQLLLVGQKGFAAGSVAPVAQNANNAGYDPNRFNNLAILYARLVTSDPVRSLILQQGSISPGQAVQAAPVIQAGSNTPLPMISVTGIGTTPADSVDMARRASNALVSYIGQQQRINRVSQANRVRVTVLEQASLLSPLHDDPTTPQLIKGRSKTRPIVLFLVIMLGAIGLAFLRENLKRAPLEEEDRGTAPYPPLGPVGDADTGPARATAFVGTRELQPQRLPRA